MRYNAWMFIVGAVLFVAAGLVYGILTDWTELVGAPGIMLVGGMSAMIGVYLLLTHRHFGTLPEDREDAEVEDADPDYGFFSPWSWWPIVAAAGAAITFAGMAVGFWMMPFGFVIAVIGITGWVYEYSSGNFQH